MKFKVFKICTAPARFGRLVELLALAFCIYGIPASAQSFNFGYGGGDVRITLAIKSDGNCLLTNETTQPRKALEMQITSWERYQKMAEGGTEEDEAVRPVPQPSKPPAKPLTDQELAAKIREMHDQRSEFNPEPTGKIESVEVTSNSVRTVTTGAYGSIKDLLSQNLWSWGPNILAFENARFEMDTNSHLRITFTPGRNMERYAKYTTRAWKTSKTKFEWKLFLPGKILSSGLPNTKENSSWLALDAEKPESVDAALKLIGAPLIVTAESGGIKLAEPLEAKNLMRSGRNRSVAAPDLPITDAGPGFVAEPVSVTLSTVHYFPEGEKFFKDRPLASYIGSEPAGAVVSAKLFPPKGRIIKSLSQLKVKNARDDKGRALTGSAAETENDELESYSQGFSNNDDSEKNPPARLDLRLGLPAPDAKTIEEIEAEAVVLTFGNWKEMTLSNPQAAPKRELDLGEVLPGAKLVIKKLTAKGPQTMIEARLEGPPAISQLDLKIKMPPRTGSSNLSERHTSTAAGKTTRDLTLHAYRSEPDGASGGAVTLLIRSPQDVKRERVRFKLTALDLL